MKKFVVLASAVALSCSLLCLPGCAGGLGQESPEQVAQREAREYMSDVHVIVGQLEQCFTDFAAAAAVGDTAAMEKCASDATLLVEDLATLEAPESLQDVHQKYSDAANALQGIISDYLKMFTGEVDLASLLNPESIASLQQRYDEALKLLQSADELAATL